MAGGVIAFVDTTIIVDVLRQYPPALSWFQHQSFLGVTPVTWMEVVYGAQNKLAQQQSTRLLSQFDIEYFQITDMDWAMQQLIKFRLSHNVGLMDCLIASVCYRLQLPLYTHNRKHVEPILGKSLTVS